MSDRQAGVARRASRIYVGRIGCAMPVASIARGVLLLAMVCGAATISGCQLAVGYCLSSYSSLCPRNTSEWGPGTDVGYSEGVFKAYFQEFRSTRWTFDKSTVVASGGFGHVATKYKQPDFKLQVQYRVQDGARAAIVVRAADQQTITERNAYEILIAGGGNDAAVGSITGFPSSSRAVLSNWGINLVEIIVEGPRVSVMINGTVTTDLEVDRTSDGYIALTFQPGAGGHGKLVLYKIRKRWLRIGERAAISRASPVNSDVRLHRS